MDCAGVGHPPVEFQLVALLVVTFASFCSWVAQRFTAAITALFSDPASAAEVTQIARGRSVFGDWKIGERPVCPRIWPPGFAPRICPPKALRKRASQLRPTLT